MTETVPIPSNEEDDPQQLRRWRRWAWVVRLVWWLLILAGLLLCATQVLLHQVLVPKVQEYRPQLEREASDLLGVPVRIGSVQALGGGWVPSFELREVSLLGPDGAVALRLPRVVAAVSVRSIWSLGFEQIYLDAPELDVRRDAKGRIRVAGLVFGSETQEHSPAADWFFSQTEFVIRNGTLKWTDEIKAAPSIQLNAVNVVIRNPGLHHQFHLEATPADNWGDRFAVQADLTHAFWETQEGNWRRWKGGFFVELGRVDVSQLHRHTNWGGPVEKGRGAMRLWGEMDHGLLSTVTADLALEGVSARLGEQLQPLDLQVLTGRVGGRQSAFGGGEFFTQNLQFTTQDGVKWPGGNVAFRQEKTSAHSEMQGHLKADKLDLATLAQIADRLPINELQHGWLRRLAPQGRVETLVAQWTGELAQAHDWRVQADLRSIALLPEASPSKAEPGRPGVTGLNVELDASSSGGSAKVLIENGSLNLPGVFEQALVPIDQLKGRAVWRADSAAGKPGWKVEVDNLQFANHDAQGSGRLSWHSLPQEQAADGVGGPGHLEMDLQLGRADGAQVHRYMPLTSPQFARDYLKAAIIKGSASEVKVRVAGDLSQMPFEKGNGEFHISAPIRDAQFAYLPSLPALSGRQLGVWPEFTGLNGMLVIDRNSLEVRNATAQVAGYAKLQVQKVQARIARLGDPVVEVQGEVKGPLADQMQVVRLSPLNELMGGAMSRATGTGDVLTQLQMTLPTADINKSRVQGTVNLAGNDVRLSPDLPLLSRVKTALNFSEKGFSFKAAQARFLGGDLKLDGGTFDQASPNDLSLQIRGAGTATAVGLREARELGLTAQLAKSATGSFNYNLTVGVRKGRPEVLLTSNLQGLALQLPAPLSKTTEQILPLRYSQALRRDALGGVQLVDDISLDVGTLVNVDFVRDVSSATPRVLKGTIGIGLPKGQELPMPDSGVYASVIADKVDVDAWESLLHVPAPQAGGSRQNMLEPVLAYMPNSMAIQAGQLVVDGHVFNKVVVGGGRDGAIWRANMDAQELSGYMELRQAQGNTPGSLYARIARLSLAAADASEIENVIEQPLTVPALDLVVEDLEYKGRKLGRLEVDAINQGAGAQREWRLRKLNLQVPEASISVKGNWVRVGQQTTAAPAAPAAPSRARGILRRTALQVRMDINDAGKLLQRMGMGELLRKTPGVIEGQLSWVGSPFALDYPSMQGKLNVDMKEGQFLKVDPGAARLLGVLSLQSLPRRLALDFRDVFSEGFAFDNIRGDVSIENGIAKTNNLQMKGVVAGVLMEGSANIAKETQDLHVVVVPEINAGSASLFAATVNPVVGLGTFLAQAILRRPLIKQNTQEFRVEGSWADPKITKLESHSEAPSPSPANPASQGAISQ